MKRIRTTRIIKDRNSLIRVDKAVTRIRKEEKTRVDRTLITAETNHLSSINLLKIVTHTTVDTFKMLKRLMAFRVKTKRSLRFVVCLNQDAFYLQ